ncbi:MAG TPA: hypothetical protein VGZ22_11425, partial [Isosphaeraceae bacterium]|nr:hypothetical protein [Isosphaeraceae bacterium]
MSVLLHSLPLLWAQAPGPGVSKRLFSTLSWLFVYGEPSATVNGFWGPPVTWLKVVALFSLLGWVGGWVIAAIKERATAGSKWLNIAALVALLGGALAMLMHVLETTERISKFVLFIGGKQSVVSVLTFVCGIVILVWIERLVWASILRLGKSIDLYVLAGMHLALGMGVLIAFMLLRLNPNSAATWQDAVIQGGRLGATYMGFVVLFRVLWLLGQEVIAVRWRRLYAIAWLSVIESMRRMWAPWVVIAVFLVILAFTDWFLIPPRTAEMGRLYVGTLALLCSLLITVMVAILTPISLPHDIQMQTIYTVVSKPVRRVELVWGRILGFMCIVTVLLGLFGFISLAYLYRTVHGKIEATESLASRAAQQNRPERARQLREEADQLRTRMSARLPVKGSLTFIDSRGTPQIKGIDVGQELEFRSHIEGATPAMAIWQFGSRVPDPFDLKIAQASPQHPIRPLNLRIPIESLLRADSIEGLLNQIVELKYQEAMITAQQRQPNLPVSEGNRLTAELGQLHEQSQRITAEYERLKSQADDLDAKAKAAADAGKKGDADSFHSQAAAMHSPNVPLEMTFTVYRTTKGTIGEPVGASLKVINPHTGEDYVRVFSIREYYTNKEAFPASVLAGSRGDLRIEVKCISPTQYLGMSESDLFILAQSGDFGTNFMKGLCGIWLQALVLTAIGVWAGTFLSWPVALLTTLAFFVAGQVAFGFLQEFAMQTLQGGGPFESLIRLLSHDNMQTELTPTLAVVTAKTLDSIVMPIMSRLVYIVPNFGALDVSNTVADGFAVTNSLLFWRGLM